MTQKLSIEQLKFAREIGATDTRENWYEGLFRNVSSSGYEYWNKSTCKWEKAQSPNFASMIKIDFTPLDDYYADKEFDIKATGGDLELTKEQRKDYDDGCVEAMKEDIKVARDSADADMVNHPPHYQTDGIECIDAIRASLGLEGFVAYCRGNAIKYSWRAGKKDETAQDLKKAAWYLNRAADELIKNNERTAGVNK